MNPEVDSYSAFFDNAGAGGSDTGLTDMIRGVTEVDSKQIVETSFLDNEEIQV